VSVVNKSDMYSNSCMAFVSVTIPNLKPSKMNGNLNDYSVFRVTDVCLKLTAMA